MISWFIINNWFSIILFFKFPLSSTSHFMLICYNSGTIDNTFDTFMYFSKEPTCQRVRTHGDSDFLTWLRGKFEGTKLVIIRHTLKEGRQYNGQKERGQRDKHWPTKHYIENLILRNTNPTKKWGWIHMPRKGRYFLLHKWHSSCYCC